MNIFLIPPVLIHPVEIKKYLLMDFVSALVGNTLIHLFQHYNRHAQS